MYIKDDIEKDHYAKAYKTYADIQFSSKAKYNMQVLEYRWTLVRRNNVSIILPL